MSLFHVLMLWRTLPNVWRLSATDIYGLISKFLFWYQILYQSVNVYFYRCSCLMFYRFYITSWQILQVWWEGGRAGWCGGRAGPGPPPGERAGSCSAMRRSSLMLQLISLRHIQRRDLPGISNWASKLFSISRLTSRFSSCRKMSFCISVNFWVARLFAFFLEM